MPRARTLGPQDLVEVRPSISDARARPVAERPALPRWPLAVGLAGYPVWWLLGVGDMIWPLLALVMAHFLVRRGGTRVPRGFGVWALFLVWTVWSVVAVDTSGRLIGFVYRLLLHLAATVAFVYVYNGWRSLTPRYVAGVLTSFWLVVVAGGYAGLAWPLLSVRTPLAYVLPGGLLSNELVQEMVVRRLTQFEVDSFAQRYPRPSAPFLYTNGWGYAYSVLLPVALAYLYTVRRERRALLLGLAIPASMVPAFLTLNRGMFIGLGVALLYLAVRALLSGNARLVLAVVLAAAVGAGAFLALPVKDRLTDRLEVSSTTEDRANLYREAWERSLESPLLGHGAPRPSLTPGAPSVGTQGQVWLVLFSYGLPALALFLASLALAFVRSTRGRDPILLTFSAVLLVTSVEVFYYGVIGTGMVLPAVAAGVALRPASLLPGVRRRAERPVPTPARGGVRCPA